MKHVAKLTRIAGALVAYGAFAACIALVGLQLVRWFRNGEWTHIGISDGLRSLLGLWRLRDGGRLAGLAQWLDAPTDWYGWHRVLDVIPASVGLFALSIAGNFVRIRAEECDDDGPRESPP
ncbi:MAG: hypothetical protein KGL92_09980 [Gammaproteobacteria bacterium]|nr:hypothetical protein [Gammaproteobacteria bacterium]MDE2348819.1 hypothetical protein [Gammaproteobacteria bacterium]